MILKGRRIRLRKLKRVDARSLFMNVNDKEIARFTTIPFPYLEEYARQFISKAHKSYRNKTAYQLGIEFNRQIIGMMSLTKVDYESKHAEIGYWVGKQYWNQGTGLEALKLLIDFSFKELGLERLYAFVLHQNTASAHLLEKAGFKLEGRMRKHTFRYNEWSDDLVYGLLREEYTKKEV